MKKPGEKKREVFQILSGRSKGSVTDIIFISIFLTVFGVVVIFSYYILNQFIGIGLNDTILNNTGNGLKLFNYGFLVLTFASGVASIIGAFMLDSHPVFFVIFTFIFLVFLVISVVLSNVFDEIITQTQLVGSASVFDKIVLVLRNLPLVVTVWFVLVTLALYGKMSGSRYGV